MLVLLVLFAIAALSHIGFAVSRLRRVGRGQWWLTFGPLIAFGVGCPLFLFGLSGSGLALGAGALAFAGSGFFLLGVSRYDRTRPDTNDA